MEKKETWIRIAENIEQIHFAENNIAAINVEGKSICVIKTPKGLKACVSKCPHACGDLSSGFLDKRGNIICPVHGYRFNLNNGRDTEGEGYFLKMFEIKEDDDGVYITLTE